MTWFSGTFPKLVRMYKQMELQFQIECMHHVAVVRCSGRLVRGEALEAFRLNVIRLERARIILLDLSEVSHIDAGALGTLLQLRCWARKQAVLMKLVDPSPFVRRVLEATRLTAVFDISSLEEALCILHGPDCQQHYAVA
jgi:anti-anti-sigma factor